MEEKGWKVYSPTTRIQGGFVNKIALIFGITGQDGSYLAELLLNKGYEVHGLIRKSATGNTKNIDHILDLIEIHRGDLADTTSIYRVINSVMPDEIYNEADQDHVSWSYDSVDYTCDITGAAVARILEIIKQIIPGTKFFQPLSSNIFGNKLNSWDRTVKGGRILGGRHSSRWRNSLLSIQI